MSESGKWTDVEYSELDDITIKKNSSNSNINVSLRLSPLDVPIAWRHSIDEDSKVVLDFKYLSTAESLASKTVENITFEIGKNSRRIYRIVVDVNGPAKAGVARGKVSIEFIQASEAVTSATATLNDNGVVKKPNARAILSMLEHEAGNIHTAAG